MIVAIVVVLVVAIGALLWYQTSKTKTPATSNKTSTSGVQTVPAITSLDDLTTAETTLDQTDVTVNASDEATLDGYMKEF